MMALIVILTLSVSVRYLFASGGAYVAAMVPVFATVGHVTGAPTELVACSGLVLVLFLLLLHWFSN